MSAERTVDKGELCRRALDRMKPGFKPARALLIDNERSSLEAWTAHGGVGYLYTTDSTFRRDVARGIDPLCVR